MNGDTDQVELACRLDRALERSDRLAEAIFANQLVELQPGIGSTRGVREWYTKRLSSVDGAAPLQAITDEIKVLGRRSPQTVRLWQCVHLDSATAVALRSPIPQDRR